jgi:colicin import membrane protein
MISRYLSSPLVQSLLLHTALVAALWLFSAHFVPTLPPASSPLQATLVSSSQATTATETPPVLTPPKEVTPSTPPQQKPTASDTIALNKEKADKEQKAKEDKLAKEKADKEQKAKEDAARKKLQEALNKNNIDKEMAALESKIKAEKEAQLRKAAEQAAQKEAERLAQAKAQADQQAAADKASKAKNDLISKYTKQIYDAIKREWSIPPKSDELSAQVRIVLLPDGEVRSILFLKRSGNSAFDASIEAAIEKASPLPVPSDAALFSQFRSVTFNFSSKD